MPIKRVSYNLYTRNLDWMDENDKRAFLILRGAIARPEHLRSYADEKTVAFILDLANDKWLTIEGEGDDAMIVITPKGEAAYITYAKADLEYERQKHLDRIADVDAMLSVLADGSIIF